MNEITRLDLNGVNAFLVKGKDGFVLFDTGGHLVMDGEYTDRRGVIEAELKKSGVNGGNLRLIILTHGDSDHSGNAAYLRDNYGAGIAMHEGDLKLVKNPDINDFMASFKYKSVIYKLVFKIMDKKIRSVMEKVLKDFERFTPDILIDGNFKLSEYGVDGETYNLPGHTAGSLGFKIGMDFIAGDLFANNKKPSLAMNADDFNELKASALKASNLSIDTVYPGHGSPFPYKILK